MIGIYGFFQRFRAGTDGATAIEYALIAVGIALAIAASVYAFGHDVSDLLYNDLPKALSD